MIGAELKGWLRGPVTPEVKRRRELQFEKRSIFSLCLIDYLHRYL